MQIKSPIAGHTARTFVGSLVLDFKDGVAEVESLANGAEIYLRQMGYGIEGEPTPPAEPEPPVDSRDIPTVVEGAPLRDAAVDPQPEDFLPPVNAGEADPHGPSVVSPGIHAAGHKAVVPGPVGVEGEDGKTVKDTDAQAEKESAFAKDTLVDGKPVPEATKTAAAKGRRAKPATEPTPEPEQPADTDGDSDSEPEQPAS